MNRVKIQRWTDTRQNRITTVAMIGPTRRWVQRANEVWDVMLRHYSWNGWAQKPKNREIAIGKGGWWWESKSHHVPVYIYDGNDDEVDEKKQSIFLFSIYLLTLFRLERYLLKLFIFIFFYPNFMTHLIFCRSNHVNTSLVTLQRRYQIVGLYVCRGGSFVANNDKPSSVAWHKTDKSTFFFNFFLPWPALFMQLHRRHRHLGNYRATVYFFLFSPTNLSLKNPLQRCV